MKKTGCKIICGAPKTLAVKGLMMMMIMMMMILPNVVALTTSSKLRQCQASVFLYWH